MPEEPIHQAAERGDVAALRRELDDGVSPNALSGRGRTPLHYLCSRGDNPEARVDCLHVLLEAGANVNAPNVHQNTPLHLAAVRGYLQRVIAAGGFGRYERNHLNALAAIFVPKFAHRSLPPEMVRRVVECAFRVGDY